jgi:hypothetical protein
LDTAVYYTFSTIAQTLGALVGLLGAFALFRMQSLDGQIRTLCIHVAHAVGQPSELFDLINNEDFGQFDKALDRHVAKIKPLTPAQEAVVNQFHRLAKRRRQIVWSLLTAFAVTMLVIAASILALTAGPSFSKATLQVTQPYLWCGLVAFIVCAMLFGLLLRRMTQSA